MSFNYAMVGRMSCVAAIVHGDVVRRVVVTFPENVQFHVSKPGERAVIIPEIWIQEPVAWNAASSLIRMAQDYVASSK